MKIYFLLFFTAFSIITCAQKPKSDKPDHETLMFIRGIGISFQEFDELNSRVANRPEYKTLRDHAATLELGFMNVSKNIVFDAELIGGSSMSGDRDKKSSAIRFLATGIDIGYDVIPNKTILLYPMAGIGTQAYRARFYKDNAAVPFDLVLASSNTQNAIRPVDFKNAFFTYRFGIGFAIRPPKNNDAAIGIQFRYTGSFKEKSWKSSDNQELANAPKDRLSQFQVSLILGDMPMKKKN
ncbi:MAG: outer membrane beta-barrel protein [Ferruginibacter sp.]